MAVQQEGAPSWLFSFVDLAFLMLIAMTQLAGDLDAEAPDLGEMIVPRIGAEQSTEMTTGASKAWQLRVHPRVEGEDVFMPFELVLVGGEVDEAQPPPSERFAAPDVLRERLTELLAQRTERPLLAPHEESRSQDLLDAAALIEEFWPGRRRVTIARVFEP